MQKLTFLAAFIFLFSINSFAQSVHGVFRVVKGDVQVFSKSGASGKAKIGQKVFPSDRIKAGKDSRAKIVMVDKNELNISPDSEIVIENYTFKPEENQKNVLINVLYGKVRAKVEQKYDDKNKFQIKTPTAVAGVRGTDFITGFNRVERTTQVVTFEGRVEFGLPGPGGAILNPVFVSVGQMATGSAGAPPPPPIEVPQAELQQMDSGSDAAKAPGPTAQGSSQGGPQGEASQNSPQEPKENKQASSEAKSPAPAAAEGGTGNRAPSSVGGPPAGAPPAPTTIVANDLPSAGPVNVVINPGPVVLPTHQFPTDKKFDPKDILQTQNRQLKITVTNGNGP